MSTILVLFMVFDDVSKVMKVRQVIEATVRIGLTESTVVGIGALDCLSASAHVGLARRLSL